MVAIKRMVFSEQPKLELVLTEIVVMRSLQPSQHHQLHRKLYGERGTLGRDGVPGRRYADRSGIGNNAQGESDRWNLPEVSERGGLPAQEQHHTPRYQERQCSAGHERGGEADRFWILRTDAGKADDGWDAILDGAGSCFKVCL